MTELTRLVRSLGSALAFGPSGDRGSVGGGKRGSCAEGQRVMLVCTQRYLDCQARDELEGPFGYASTSVICLRRIIDQRPSSACTSMVDSVRCQSIRLKHHSASRYQRAVRKHRSVMTVWTRNAQSSGRFRLIPYVCSHATVESGVFPSPGALARSPACTISQVHCDTSC